MLSFSVIVSSIGLVLDIVGVILIFFNGLPPKVNREGKTFLVIGTGDKTGIEKERKHQFYSEIGLWLLMIGFLLQLISNWL